MKAEQGSFWLTYPKDYLFKQMLLKNQVCDKSPSTSEMVDISFLLTIRVLTALQVYVLSRYSCSNVMPLQRFVHTVRWTFCWDEVETQNPPRPP
jgi:hypothetical protein